MFAQLTVFAGFNYAFDALNPNDKPNELNEAVRQVLSATEPTLIDIIQFVLPFTRILVGFSVSLCLWTS